MKEYTAQAALVKYDNTPPALLSDSVPKSLRIVEYKDKVMMTHRLGNGPKNHIIAAGARSMGEVWAIFYGASTHVPVSGLFGAELDFEVGAKLLISIFKAVIPQ